MKRLGWTGLAREASWRSETQAGPCWYVGGWIRAEQCVWRPGSPEAAGTEWAVLGREDRHEGLLAWERENQGGPWADPSGGDGLLWQSAPLGKCGSRWPLGSRGPASRPAGSPVPGYSEWLQQEAGPRLRVPAWALLQPGRLLRARRPLRVLAPWACPPSETPRHLHATQPFWTPAHLLSHGSSPYSPPSAITWTQFWAQRATSLQNLFSTPVPVLTLARAPGRVRDGLVL